MALRYLLPGQMHFMANNGFDVLMISADGKELAEVIEKEQCRHIIVPMTRRITPLQDLKCLFRLVKIFREEKLTENDMILSFVTEVSKFMQAGFALRYL